MVAADGSISQVVGAVVSGTVQAGERSALQRRSDTAVG